MVAGNRTYLRLKPEIEEPQVKINNSKNRAGLKVLGIAAVTIGVISFAIYVAEKKSDELL